MERAGVLALPLLVLLLLAFVAWRWGRRRRVRAAAALPRIGADELQALIDAADAATAPVLIDVRSAAAAELDPRHLPGALRLDLADIARHAARLPRDRELVLYCNCPNEVSAAVAAQALRGAGLLRARPLAGGLDGWAVSGRPLAHGAWREIPALPAATGSAPA
jgi:rhodanese-related sulfurtransferase